MIFFSCNLSSFIISLNSYIKSNLKQIDEKLRYLWIFKSKRGRCVSLRTTQEKIKLVVLALLENNNKLNKKANNLYFSAKTLGKITSEVIPAVN